MIKKLYLAHSFLFAILPAAFLWGQNFGEVPLRETLPTFVVLIIFGALVWFFLWIFFRDFGKSAIISSVFLTITLSFDYIYNIFFYNSFIQLRYRWAFLILFLIFAVLWFLVKKTKKDLLNINKAITIAAGTFVLISFFQVAVGYYKAYRDVRSDDVKIVVDSSKTRELRDIYYIILDGYSSPEVIRDVMGFKEIDKTVAFLKEKGFFFPSKARSNYAHTLYSIPSSLNMSYLKDPSAHKTLFTMAEDNKVQSFLKSYGYKYLHFGAEAFDYFNRNADENISLGLLSPYQTAVLHSTLFIPVQQLFGNQILVFADRFGFLDSQWLILWKSERFKFQKLAEVPDKEKSPVFVFAHFGVPKGEYVFDENGDFLTREESEKRGIIKNYLGQVAYANKEVEKLINILLKKSDPEPIIILQGDHGFPFYVYRDVIEEFAQPDRARDLIVPKEYSFPIFNAYYFPGGGDQLLYNSITPVNTFRILFNYYFRQNLPLLDDISYTIDPNNSSKFIPWNK